MIGLNSFFDELQKMGGIRFPRIGAGEYAKMNLRNIIKKTGDTVIKKIKTPPSVIGRKVGEIGDNATSLFRAKSFNKVAQDLSDSQKEAGNYKMKHKRLLGFEYSIENPAGSTRSGTSSDGKKWSNKIYYDYGYLKGTMARDGDHLDVFANSGKIDDSAPVFIINQVDPKTRKFDEHKIMIGFDSREEARKAYLKNYEKDWKGIGSIVRMEADAFKKWAREPKLVKQKAASMTKEEVLKKIATDSFNDELQKIAIWSTDKKTNLIWDINNNFTKKDYDRLSKLSMSQLKKIKKEVDRKRNQAYVYSMMGKGRV